MAKEEIVNIKDLIQDTNNANAGTERGQLAVNNSIQTSGAGRSILIDKDGNIIAGNKTSKAAALAGLPVQIIRTDGTKLVAVMREDLDINSPEARRLAIADNRTAELGLEWDTDQLAAALEDGIDLGGLFDDWELEQMTASPEDYDPMDEWEGMPEFENEAVESYKTIKVHFMTEDAYREFGEITGNPLSDKTISVWYPRKLNEDLKKYTVIDES